ncbi:hypothetical protein D3C76_1705580 [compost metagenome]
MTQEIKCGIYRIVCEIFLNHALLISYSIIARMIGAGKETSKSRKLSINVLRRAM